MFGRKCSIIGVVHVPPLPGAAGYKGSMEEILASALSDAMIYKDGNLDALMVENMHDVPYYKGFAHPETTAAMAIVTRALKDETQLPVGVQILAGANLEALGAAIAAGADFIRVEGFVYAHVGDEGIHESCAAVLVRRRSELQCERIKIFADIKKKHSSHSITSDVSLSETAKAAEFFRADGVVITGISTGAAPEPKDVQAVRASVSCHVLVGSGVTSENVERFKGNADALIVGSYLKYDGLWKNAVDPERVKRFVEAAESRRQIEGGPGPKGIFR
jgi:membrane complex biogenesis BtpA family protein